MNCKKLIVAIIGLGVSAFTGSSAMAHGGGGGGHGGGGLLFSALLNPRLESPLLLQLLD